MGRPEGVGLQTIVLGKKYTISDPKVLDHVARCGYASVEVGVKDAAEFKKMLDERKLKHAGLHVLISTLENVEPHIKACTILESHDICNSCVFDTEKGSAANYLKSIEVLNRVGKKLRAAGIFLHHHNHDFEFQKVEGNKPGIDLLIEKLDPNACDLCVDVAWVTKGGGDNPVRFLMQNKDTVGYVHLKDYDDQGWTELGRGKVDIAGVVGILDKLPNLRHVVVEQDSSRGDPLESIAISRKYLKEKFAY